MLPLAFRQATKLADSRALIRDHKVVLILGAGASAPLGFPIGSGLVQRIIKTPEDGGMIQRFMRHTSHNFSQEQIREFSRELSLSGWKSIDRFLQHQPGLQRLGRALIAFHLIPCEAPHYLRDPPEDGHWYPYLYNDIINPSSPEQFSENRLSIITYNYDRSLEQYLLDVLRSGFGMDDRDAAATCQQIPIVHVHGSFGGLPPLGANILPYGGDLRDLLTASKRLQIVSDDIKASGVLESCANLLSDASHVVFLGFGYDPVNIERLVFSPDSLFYGTVYGLEPSEVAFAVKRPFQELHKINLQPAQPDIDCLSFLRKNRGIFR